MNYFKKISCLMAFIPLGFPLRAQLITNFGDTLSIKKGSLIYIPGDLSALDNGSKHAVFLNSGTINITGDLNTGVNTIYNGNKDSVILSGSGKQVFAGLNYGNLLVTGADTKSPAANAYFRNSITLTNGTIDTKTDTLLLDSLATLQETVNNYITGNVKTVRPMLGNYYYACGNIGVEVTTGSNAPGLTTIFRKTGNSAVQHGFCSRGTGGYYDISPANNFNIKSDIVLHYFPAELNGIAQSDLEIFRSDDSGRTWTDIGYTFKNASQYTVSINGMDTFSRYTIGSTSNPLRNALKAGKAQTICSNKGVVLGGSSLPGHFYAWTSDPAGFTSTLSSPTAYPKSDTKYYLTETVNTTTCLHNDSVLIKVTPAPDSSWTVSHKGPVYTFKANDTLETQYNWTFGDGKTANGFKTSHVYAKDGTYKVKLLVTNTAGCSAELDSTSDYHTGIDKSNALNSDLNIFPNPFSGKTNVHIRTMQACNVAITITDLSGRTLGVLTDAFQQPGDHDFEIDAQALNLSPGLYLVKTVIGPSIQINRIISLN
jgi:hypothetical protein